MSMILVRKKETLLKIIVNLVKTILRMSSCRYMSFKNRYKKSADGKRDLKLCKIECPTTDKIWGDQTFNLNSRRLMIICV